MIRKLLVLLGAAAFALAACGRQVTPDRAGTNGSGLAPGFMQMKFNTLQPLDFTNHRYIIAFNTSGSGAEPYLKYANQQANYRDLSFEIIVGGTGGAAQAKIAEIYRQQSPGGVQVGTQYFYPPVDPSLLTFSTNGNTQFVITLNRALFYGLAGVTPAPSVAPSAAPSASPAASPSASASPNAPPTTAPQATWFINFWTTDPLGNPQDAPGIGGAGDTTFSFSANTSVANDQQFTVPTAGVTQASDPSAQITGGEVSNNP
jgi:hypothetical protein